MTETSPVDLSQLSTAEARQHVGELVALCLQRSGACVLLRRKTGEITVLDPLVLDQVPEEEMAIALLSSWSEEEIFIYLKKRAERKQRPGEVQHG